MSDWVGRRVLVVTPTPTHPQDFGHRRRFFHVCSALRAAGAEVHLLHYAAEEEWRGALPFEAAREMARAWDGVWTVAPTRPLHPNPVGTHHGADEWWDPAIGQMLDWLFAGLGFDMLLVNYTWLSRALEHAPPGVLRVLDTVDRFAGRRELLEANGLAPEFFYLTSEEERRALSRAHLVWAIKEQEERWFRELGIAQVLTMPHRETALPVERTAPPHGVLRFGIVGARNSINTANATAFLELARARIARTLLPIEIHVAGGLCEALRPGKWPPWIRLLGRIPDLVDFYRNVDAVLAPMAFSTGLKIKVGEALHLGRAVIGHAHAFEGWPATHRFHTLPSFEAMLDACGELVRDPSLIGTLERASAEAVAINSGRSDAALAATLDRWEALAPGILVALPLARVQVDDPWVDLALEAAEGLGGVLPVHMLLHGPAAGRPDGASLARLARAHVVVIAADAADAADAAPAVEAALGRRLRRRGWAELAAEGHCGLWSVGGAPIGADQLPVATSLDMLPGTPFSAAFVTAATAVVPKPPGWWGRLPLYCSGSRAPALGVLRGARRRGISVLVEGGASPLTALLLDALRALDAPEPALLRPADTPGYLARARTAASVPQLVFDIAGEAGCPLLRETLDRAAVPRVVLFSQLAGLPEGGGPRFEAGGLIGSLALLRDALAEPRAWQAEANVRAACWPRLAAPAWAALRDALVAGASSTQP